MTVTTKRINKSAMRRAAQAADATITAEPEPLPADLAAYLASFAPQKTPATDLPAVRPAVVAVMRRATHLRGRATFVKHVVDVTALATWAHGKGRDLTWTALMCHAVINDFARATHPDCTPTTVAQRAARLRNLASKLNPGPASPPQIEVSAYAAVRPPYTDAEMAHILRITATQPSPIVGRKLAAIVGLARGAGATAKDLRVVRARDIADRGDDGIDVTLRGAQTARTVPVRRAYEQLVRTGAAGLVEGQLVVATRGGPNTVGSILDGVVDLSPNPPGVDAGRLRTTWIADLMCAPVPLHALLAAAGLRSARTISEIHTALAADPGSYAAAGAALRGVSA